MNQTWVRFLPAFIRSKVDGHYGLQKILSNTSWLVVDRILRMAVGLVVGVWIARYLGPEQFGLLNYAIAWVALFSPLASLGLDSLAVRDIVREPLCKDEILGTTFVLKLAGGILTLLLAVAGISMLGARDVTTQWLVGIFAAGALFQAFDSIDFWFQAQVKSQYTVYAKSAAFMCMAGVRVALIQLQAPLIAFAWVALAETALAAVGLIVAYRLQGLHLKAWYSSFDRAKTLMRSGWALALSSVAIMIYMKIDQIMLQEMVSNDAVGIYSAALRLSEVWYFIPMAITSSIFPTIVNSRGKDEELYYARLQKLFSFMVRLAYAIAVPITLLSGWLIMHLFGSHYLAAAPILAIHIWTSIFVFLGVAQESWNIAEGLISLSLQRTLIGAAINVVLNFLLIPQYSGLGAAIATVIAYAFAAVITNLIDQRTHKILLLQVKSLLLIA